jgi:hypothetical protein
VKWTISVVSPSMLAWSGLWFHIAGGLANADFAQAAEQLTTDSFALESEEAQSDIAYVIVYAIQPRRL